MYVSHDEGETWSAPQIVNDTHLGSPVFMERFGAPAHFLLHSSGALILCCGKRTEPCGQYARISWDRGLTWQEDRMIGPEAQAFATDQGYPSSVELSNGDILTAYYQRAPGDDYPSVLYTRWSLEEK